MTTNLVIVSDALRELNVIAETQSASAEQGAHALRKLNQLMETLTEDDIELGYFEQSSLAASIPIPKWAEKGIIAALAVDLAPTYGSTVSLELATKLESAMGTIRRKSISEKLQPADMDHMPMGDGHLGQGWDIATDS